MVEVLKAGLYDTIQDIGRYNVQDYGVPFSGVMDRFSAIKANVLLGNSENAAVIESTVSGPKLRFSTKTQICVTGAYMNPKLNHAPIKNQVVISIHPNDILSFGLLEQGCRVYIAVAGGFLTEEKMGSRSMCRGVSTNFIINKGDILPIHSSNALHTPLFSSVKPFEMDLRHQEVEVFEGPEFGLLSIDKQDRLFQHGFTISKDSNRMAYQFEERFVNDLKPIITSLVLPGTVQLTPSGQLIVLMRDCQTTGGYPRVLQLSENAINLVSQKFFGDKIRFKRIK